MERADVCKYFWMLRDAETPKLYRVARERAKEELGSKTAGAMLAYLDAVIDFFHILLFLI